MVSCLIRVEKIKCVIKSPARSYASAGDFYVQQTRKTDWIHFVLDRNRDDLYDLHAQFLCGTSDRQWPDAAGVYVLL